VIRITFGGSDQRFLARVREKGPQVEAALTKALDVLMLKLQRHIVADKLSGQVLAQRSGKLAASVNKEPTERRGDQIIGRVSAAAGPAFYGRIQEMGGTRAYTITPVNKKALAFFPSGSLGGGGGISPLAKSEISGLYKHGALRTNKFGKFNSYGGVVVKSVQHPPLPARPFMRPSLEDMRGEIVARLQEAVKTAVSS
jgi:hypothetical protein